MRGPPRQRPTDTSGSTKLARGEPIRMSAHEAMTAPAPMAGPSTTAMDGWGRSSSSPKTRRASSWRRASASAASAPDSAASSVTSAPAQNARSLADISTITETPGSAPTRSNAAPISLYKADDSAFTGGRSSVTVATRSAISTRTPSDAITSSASPRRQKYDNYYSSD